MSSDRALPFDLDATIRQRFEGFPQSLAQPPAAPATGNDPEHENDAPLAARSPTQPQLWRLTGGPQAKPATALDRPLEELAFSHEAFQDLPDLNITGTHELLTRLGPIKFDGSALLCRCPSCQAPMSIRLWLGLADCWRCPASIVLDEHLVEHIADNVAIKEVELPAPPPMPVELFWGPPLDPPAGQPQPQLEYDVAPTTKENPFKDQYSAELDQLTRRSTLAIWLRRIFRITPAWLISLCCSPWPC